MIKKVKYFKDFRKAYKSLTWRVYAKKDSSPSNDSYSLYVDEDALINVKGLLFRVPPKHISDYTPIMAVCNEQDGHNVVEHLKGLSLEIDKMIKESSLENLRPRLVEFDYSVDSSIASKELYYDTETSKFYELAEEE